MFIIFSYIANSYNSVCENDNTKIDTLKQEPESLENSLNLINNSLMNTTVDKTENVSVEKLNEQIKIDSDILNKSSLHVETSNNMKNEVLPNIQAQVCIWLI